MPQSALDHIAVDVTAPAAKLGKELAAWSEQVIARRPGMQSPLEAQQMEADIAAESNALQSGVMHLGPQTQYTCPDCHGVLMRIEEGRIVRFRCHTGHGFSIKTLIAEIDTAIDNGLWATVRTIEERLLLLREQARIARSRGAVAEAEEYEAQASRLEAPIDSIRKLVLDPSLFGQ